MFKLSGRSYAFWRRGEPPIDIRRIFGAENALGI